jgi:hypothetical protein
VKNHLREAVEEPRVQTSDGLRRQVTAEALARAEAAILRAWTAMDEAKRNLERLKAIWPEDEKR